MAFEFPKKSEVGVLSPDIAGEGQQVIINSNGEAVNWSPPPAKPVMPDWSGIKAIAKYFNRTGYSPWPSWVYHPTEAPRLLKNADEGAELGICYREATQDEISRYGKTAVWDWKDDCKWRPAPWEGTVKFDFKNPDHGKNIVLRPADPSVGQNELVRMLIPEVAAAVAHALKGSGAPAAPANINAADWAEFQQFLAYKKSTEAVNALADAADAPRPNSPLAPATTETIATGVTQDQERSMWVEEAESRGVKIDKRWSTERIKQEVEKAAA